VIAFDTTALSFLFIPGYQPSTSVKFGKERLDALVKAMQANDDKIGIPTPALSEFLVTCDASQTDEFLKMVRVSPWLQLCEFDSAAAIEVAMRTRKAIDSGDKREGLAVGGQKIKFDRQIVGIAIAFNATSLISDDPHVKGLGDRWGMEVKRVDELPIPEHLVPPPLIATIMEADEQAAAARVVTETPHIPNSEVSQGKPNIPEG
jgi:hypothetical protein